MTIKLTKRLGGAAWAAILLAGCAGIPGLDDQTGLACQHPPREVPGADARDPFGPGEPFANRDPTTMAAGEVAAIAIDAGLPVTYRLSYRIGQAGTDGALGYSECWCVPPPIGKVTDLGFDSGGRLIIFVESGQTLEQARAQPRMGWGCDDPQALVGPRRMVWGAQQGLGITYARWLIDA